MRIKCTKEGSNGRVGGAECVPVRKAKACHKNSFFYLFTLPFERAKHK